MADAVMDSGPHERPEETPTGAEEVPSHAVDPIVTSETAVELSGLPEGDDVGGAAAFHSSGGSFGAERSPVSVLAEGGPTLRIFPLSNYGFGEKDPAHEKDATVIERKERFRRMFLAEGMRRSVEGVILVHQHGHPHVLLLQIGNFFKLPGGRLRPGEDEVEVLKTKLSNKLAPTIPSYNPAWEVGELLCTHWRPGYEITAYPYLPPHVTKPKECRKMFVVTLPERCYFSVPKNYKLLAVPLFELYDNNARYGPQIAAIPQLLGRFNTALQ